MLIDPKIGDSVKLRADSRWFGSGDNPSDTALAGQITGIEGEWLDVLWTGDSSPLNYKSYDLDSAV